MILKRLTGLVIGRFLVLATMVCCSFNAVSGDTETDNALWAGGLFLFEREEGLDMSVEYQLREADNMSSLSSHFVEFMGYHKASENLLLNGGYRHTLRSGESEHRLYMGGFYDLTKTARGLEMNPDLFRATLQIGYQRDKDVAFDNEIMDSNSIRWILVASKPATEKIRPFLLGGILTTWNEAYDFGVDKIRLGGGLHYQFNSQSRLRIQYIWEKFKFRTPEKETNIIWLRYERRFGS
jgi:hypothetical protein